MGGGFNPRNTSTFPRFDHNGDPWDPIDPPPGVPNPQAGHYDLHPAYRNCCYFVFKQFFLGASPNMPNVEVILKRGCKFFSGARFESDPAGGVNPMGPLYEILTDDLFGAGLPEAEFDSTSFQTLQPPRSLRTAFFFRPCSFPRPRSARSSAIISATSTASSAATARSSRPAIFPTARSIRAASSRSPATIFTSEPQIQPGTLEDTKNYFTVQFTNRDTWFYNDFATYTDPSNFNQVGEQRDDAPSRPFIITAAGAQRFITE